MDQVPMGLTEIEVLYRQHGAALLLFATSIAGERSRAQDMVHQVFLKLLESEDLKLAKDKKAFLFACVRNAILSEHKRIGHRQVPLNEDTAWFSPPEKDYAGERNLRRALRTLPDDQRQVVILHIWGELTFCQIGDVLEVSSNTAASRYSMPLGS